MRTLQARLGSATEVISGLLGWFRLPRGRLDWARGVKLAVAMMAPLIAGIVIGRPLDGLFVAVGAFVVASTDIGGAYRARAIVLGFATLGVGGAYLVGAMTGARLWLAAPLLGLVLFASALAAALGARAAVASTVASRCSCHWPDGRSIPASRSWRR